MKEQKHNKYSKEDFRVLSLEERYEILKKEGEHIGARLIGNHSVHLYAVSGFFVEMWILISFNQVQWIEIQKNQSILNEYINQIDIKKDLGL